MTLLSLEIFGTVPLLRWHILFDFSDMIKAPTQNGKVPDAAVNEIVAVFYSYQLSEGETPRNGILVTETGRFHQDRLANLPAEVFPSELDLLNTFADIVVNLDPDILVGWEIERGSWGYLDARARHYGILLRASGSLWQK